METKQSKANEADVSFCSKDCKASKSPSLPGFDGGLGWGKNRQLREKMAYSKDKSSLNFTKKQEEKLPILIPRQDKVLAL